MKLVFAWMAYVAWRIPGLLRYCHRCDRIQWGWQRCAHTGCWHCG